MLRLGASTESQPDPALPTPEILLSPFPPIRRAGSNGSRHTLGIAPGVRPEKPGGAENRGR